MSGAQPMGSVRRRIPGMTSQRAAADAAAVVDAAPLAMPGSALEDAVAPVAPEPMTPASDESAPVKRGPKRAPRTARTTAAATVPERRPPVDYASTRLVNFRIPVDLHDHYRTLVREAEVSHPRLRRPSLTELVIALLAEGPETADEVAELIRRKRAAEHGLEG